jgi:hypothetical protein
VSEPSSCKFCGDPLPEGAEPGSACGREPRLLRRLVLPSLARVAMHVAYAAQVSA